MGQKRLRQRLSNRLGRDQIHAPAHSLKGVSRSLADSCYLRPGRKPGTNRRQTAYEELHGVGTGEEQPIEPFQMLDRLIERRVAGGLCELDGRNEDRLGSRCEELGGQFRRLPGRAGDKNTWRLDHGWVPISLQNTAHNRKRLSMEWRRQPEPHAVLRGKTTRTKGHGRFPARCAWEMQESQGSLGLTPAGSSSVYLSACVCFTG